jgi:inhibitor of cysteine peptidase
VPEIAVTQDESGGTISVSPGDTVLIKLHENPTTGYRWHIEAAHGLVLTDDDFVAGVGVGAGGERRFRFAAASPGRASIAMSLGRFWDTSPQARFELSVDVRAHRAD